MWLLGHRLAKKLSIPNSENRLGVHEYQVTRGPDIFNRFTAWAVINNKESSAAVFGGISFFWIRHVITVENLLAELFFHFYPCYQAQ